MNLLEQWLNNKINHKEIGPYLIEMLKIKTLAIYGAGRYGEFLFDDLSDYVKIEVKYFIDKNADSLYYGIDNMNILNLSELRYATQVDAIIVTPYQHYGEIKEELKMILPFETMIISLKDIVDGVE